MQWFLCIDGALAVAGVILTTFTVNISNDMGFVRNGNRNELTANPNELYPRVNWGEEVCRGRVAITHRRVLVRRCVLS